MNQQRNCSFLFFIFGLEATSSWFLDLLLVLYSKIIPCNSWGSIRGGINFTRSDMYNVNTLRTILFLKSMVTQTMACRPHLTCRRHLFDLLGVLAAACSVQQINSLAFSVHVLDGITFSVSPALLCLSTHPVCLKQEISNYSPPKPGPQFPVKY